MAVCRAQKLISGRYLGEILRLVICELIDEGVLFLGQNTYKLENPYCFDTAFLSLMERCVSLSTSSRLAHHCGSLLLQLAPLLLLQLAPLLLIQLANACTATRRTSCSW